MDAIRILLIDMPRLLRDIIGQLISVQPDMEIVAEMTWPRDLISAIRRCQARIVIIGHEGQQVHDRCEDIVLQRPDVAVLTVSAGGRQTVVHEVRPWRMALGEVSPEQLTDAIRDVHVRLGARFRARPNPGP